MKVVPIVENSSRCRKDFKHNAEKILCEMNSGVVESAFLCVLYKDGSSFHQDYSEYGKPYVYRLIGLLEVSKKYLMGLV